MKTEQHDYSRRERQIMDIIYAKGEATAQDVQESLPDAPGYSAVRALLRIMEEKGFLKHREEGRRYVYLPKEASSRARRSALRRVMETFFDGSFANAVAALVDDEDLSSDELARIENIIQEAKSRKGTD